MQRLGGEGLINPPLLPPAFGIAGYKNSGKTTLIVALLQELVGRGWRLGTIKHAHHDFDIDRPGKDSYRHRSAGATEVIVASARRVAHIRELDNAGEPELHELLGRMGPVDLVLVEGWKSGSHPRLELRRAEAPAMAIAGRVPGVLAIVSETLLPSEVLPVLLRADVPAIADFILSAVGLPRNRAS